MASELFSLSYDGDDIRNGEMDVATLGPALIAMGELFTAANEVLNGTQTTVETKVKADFKEGSFEVIYSINQIASDPHSAIIPGLYVLGSSPLVNQVIGKIADKAKDKAVEGLFSLLERLKGKIPEKSTFDESKNVYIFNTGDNVNISVEQPTGELYRSARVRSAAARVASPLARPGISKLVVKRDKKDVAALGKSDIPELPQFEPTIFQTYLEDGINGNAPQELVVRILKPSFAEGKWSVSDGTRKFDVRMEDEEFIERVHSREIGFFDGDLYRVEMLTKQKVNGQRLSTERTITRVIAPLPIAEQSALALSSEDSEQSRTRKKRTIKSRS